MQLGRMHKAGVLVYSVRTRSNKTVLNTGNLLRVDFGALTTHVQTHTGNYMRR